MNSENATFQEMVRRRELRVWFENAPLARTIPMTLLGLDKGAASVALQVRESYLVEADSKRIVQGGILATLADAAAVTAAMSLFPSGHTPLAHLDMAFLLPVTLEDETIIAAAEAIYETPRAALVKFAILGKNSEIKAFGTARFAKPKS